MQIIRFTHKNSEPQYGWINDAYVGLLSSPPFGAYRRLEATIPLEEVRLLAPVQPSKILAIGRNYAEHAKEHGVEIPDVPVVFLKPPSALLNPGGTIILPPQSTQVEHESELGVVISRSGRWIRQEDVTDHILGYTIVNDVTARDLQNRDNQWTRCKGFDTFCPVGPWIETDLDPSDILITCRVNGEIRQMSSTREMVFSIKQLIVFISSIMTLEPGDLLITGTPAGVGRLADGDTVEAEIEGIGILSNLVKEEKK
jgi:2-keto-4-pentenoate hydratase/2-oxohepta-3-ene-1,7-dioic acid hydratase in catechol pathway